MKSLAIIQNCFNVMSSICVKFNTYNSSEFLGQSQTMTCI